MPITMTPDDRLNSKAERKQWDDACWLADVDPKTVAEIEFGDDGKIRLAVLVTVGQRSKFTNNAGSMGEPNEQ